MVVLFGVFVQPPVKLGNILLFYKEACGICMTAELFQNVGACSERVEQVNSLNASARAFAPIVFN